MILKVLEFIILSVYIISSVNALWPLPQYWEKGSKTLSISPDFSLKQAPETDSLLHTKTKKILESAKKRFLKSITFENYTAPNVNPIVPESIDKSNTLSVLIISITTDISELELG
ncbi:10875_t:CDS:1, partial [Racocetra persica]